MFRKHKFIWLSLLALLAIACGVGAYQHYQKSFVFYAPELVINDYEMIGDNDAVVIDWRLKKDGEIVSNTESERWGVTSDSFHFLLVRGHYASSMPMRLKEDPVIDKFQRNRAQSGEYWKIVVYDLENKGATPKEYDVFEMVQKYNNEYAPGLAHNCFFGYTYNGKEYRELVVRKINDANDRKVLLMNLSTGELIEKPEELREPVSRSLVEVTSLGDSFKNVLLDFPVDSSIVLSSWEKDTSNLWRLGEEHKKALLMMQRNSARLYRLKSDSSKENLASIFKVWQLLLPEDKELFSDLILHPEYSVDYKEHVIKNVEEFQKYYKKNNAQREFEYRLN